VRDIKLFGRKLEGFPKVLVILVTVLLLASGLCGVTGEIETKNGWFWLGKGLPNTPLGNALTILDLIGDGAFMISALGIASVLIGWPLSFLYVRITKPERDRTQKLFADRDETKHDGQQ
jgi:hypothetical protein